MKSPEGISPHWCFLNSCLKNMAMIAQHIYLRHPPSVPSSIRPELMLSGPGKQNHDLADNDQLSIILSFSRLRGSQEVAQPIGNPAWLKLRSFAQIASESS